MATYRVRGRFPVVIWKHPDHPQVLLRSSQPLTGILGARSEEDERLVGEVLKCGKGRFWILDARGYAAALGNGYVGGGFENTGKINSETFFFLTLN